MIRKFSAGGDRLSAYSERCVFPVISLRKMQPSFSAICKLRTKSVVFLNQARQHTSTRAHCLGSSKGPQPITICEEQLMGEKIKYAISDSCMARLLRMTLASL